MKIESTAGRRGTFIFFSTQIAERKADEQKNLFGLSGQSLKSRWRKINRQSWRKSRPNKIRKPSVLGWSGLVQIRAN